MDSVDRFTQAGRQMPTGLFNELSMPYSTLSHGPAGPSRTLRWMFLGILAMLGLATLASCRTTSGFGDDVKHLGSGIEKSADKHTD
ncbi:MAG: hypothetical protein NTV94_05540 [Planctomycetota bacterium]|nr:hypothetical protein [Planctomycetota bacterium]